MAGRPQALTPELRAARAEAGRRGMRSRWGPQRVIRLDSLPVEVRAAVVTLVEAAKKAASVVSETSTEAAMETDGNARRRLPPAA